MIPFLLGSYTGAALILFTIIATIARPRTISHWLWIILAAVGWPITLMMIRTA